MHVCVALKATKPVLCSRKKKKFIHHFQGAAKTRKNARAKIQSMLLIVVEFLAVMYVTWRWLAVSIVDIIKSTLFLFKSAGIDTNLYEM